MRPIRLRFHLASGERNPRVLPMSFDQGQFDFDAPGTDAGWRRWRGELEKMKRAFESRWGVVLGRRVMVHLRDQAKPLCGLIEWIEPTRRERDLLPRFRLRGLEFAPGNIEGLVQEE